MTDMLNSSSNYEVRQQHVFSLGFYFSQFSTLFDIDVHAGVETVDDCQWCLYSSIYRAYRVYT